MGVLRSKLSIVSRMEEACVLCNKNQAAGLADRRVALCWPAIHFVLCVVLVALPRVAADEVRTWSDKTGAFTREAEFVAIEAEDVVLKTPTGKVLRVPLAKLSDPDQSYVKDAQGLRRERTDSAGRQIAGSGAADIPTKVARDPREFWTSPYFNVRKIPGGELWVLTVNVRQAFPFVLREISRDYNAVVVANPKNTFQLALACDQAVPRFPEPAEAAQSYIYSGRWADNDGALRAQKRTWHPAGAEIVEGFAGFAWSTPSEELEKQLADPSGPETILIVSGKDEKLAELAFKDLPAGEREVARQDLRFSNAMRLIRRRHGNAPIGQGHFYKPDPAALMTLWKAMPADFQELAKAAEGIDNYKSAQEAVKKAIHEYKGMQVAIEGELEKRPILGQPLAMDSEEYGQLIETISTKYPEEIFKTAIAMIHGKNTVIARLGEAVASGNDNDILNVMAGLSDNERDTLFILSTTSLYGRVISEKCGQTHVGMLLQACRRVVACGPAVCEVLKNQEAAASQEIIGRQLKSMSGNE